MGGVSPRAEAAPPSPWVAGRWGSGGGGADDTGEGVWSYVASGKVPGVSDSPSELRTLAEGDVAEGVVVESSSAPAAPGKDPGVTFSDVGEVGLGVAGSSSSSALAVPMEMVDVFPATSSAAALVGASSEPKRTSSVSSYLWSSSDSVSDTSSGFWVSV